MTIELITTEIGEELRAHMAASESPYFDEEKQFIEAVWRIVQKHVDAEREKLKSMSERHFMQFQVGEGIREVEIPAAAIGKRFRGIGKIGDDNKDFDGYLMYFGEDATGRPEMAFAMPADYAPEPAWTYAGYRREEPLAADVAAERDACAKIAQERAALTWKIYKGLVPENGSLQRGSSYTEGQADCASDIAEAIRSRGQKP